VTTCANFDGPVRRLSQSTWQEQSALPAGRTTLCLRRPQDAGCRSVATARTSKADDAPNPVFDVDGGKFVTSTPEIAGVRMQDIGEKVGSFDHRRTEIIAALY
jgi:hypothetical protein